MWRLLRATVAGGVVLGASACQRPVSGAPADDGGASAAWPAEFAPYPGARRLCSGRAPAGALRVRWTAYAAADDPAAVTAFYARASGGDPARRPFLVRGRGTTTLAVHAATASDYPRCPQGPGPGERAVILVTTAAPRFAPTKEDP